MWVAAHGIMIVTPVNWYQVSSPLKLMMDRLVCADGGNPDPTRTSGKDAKKAKQLELAGWDYPRHLAGRLFAVVVHGDAEDVCWSEAEQLLIRMCDELDKACSLSDQLWEGLRNEYSEEAMLELLMLAGYYRTISYLTNALKLPLEAFGARFTSS